MSSFPAPRERKALPRAAGKPPLCSAIGRTRARLGGADTTRPCVPRRNTSPPISSAPRGPGGQHAQTGPWADRQPVQPGWWPGQEARQSSVRTRPQSQPRGGLSLHSSTQGVPGTRHIDQPDDGSRRLQPLGPSGQAQTPPALEIAARSVVREYDQWRSRTKPAGLSNAVEDLRNALPALSASPSEPTAAHGQ
jgi:hypothetical protein